MSKVILIVDDARDLREVVGEVLSDEGYTTSFAATGREALDYLHGPLRRPSLILLDVGMPDMDGHSFLALRAADSELASIPVVILSGMSDLSAYAALAGVAYLIKPFAIEELLAVVKRHCS